MLGRLYPSGVILAPEGTFSSGQEVPVENCRYIIRVHEMTAARIRDIEEVLNNMVRYDGSMTMVQTHVGLLDRLEVLMGNQTECRTGFFPRYRGDRSAFCLQPWHPWNSVRMNMSIR